MAAAWFQLVLFSAVRGIPLPQAALAPSSVGYAAYIRPGKHYDETYDLGLSSGYWIKAQRFAIVISSSAQTTFAQMANTLN